MQTKTKLILCVTALTIVSGCSQTISGSETSKAICKAWGQGLADPSRKDTLISAKALDDLRRRHGAACEGMT